MSTRQSRSPKAFPDTPVKLIWSAEEDQAHDFYGDLECKMSDGIDAAVHLNACTFVSRSRSIRCSIRKGIVDGKEMRQLQVITTRTAMAIGLRRPNLLINTR